MFLQAHQGTEHNREKQPQNYDLAGEATEVKVFVNAIFRWDSLLLQWHLVNIID